MVEQNSRASTEVSRIIKASREAIYQAFVDEDLLVQWLPPDGMTGRIHNFEPHAGGQFRLSLTYQDVAVSPDGKGGKSSNDTDTVQGRFVELIPNAKVVWVTEFESDDESFAGEMTIITWLEDADNGTKVTMRCENIPAGIRPEDNETGTRESLQNLARLLEQ